MLDETCVHSIAVTARDLAVVGADGQLRLSRDAIGAVQAGLAEQTDPIALTWILSSLLTVASMARKRGSTAFADQLTSIAISKTGALRLLNASRRRESFATSPNAMSVTGREPPARMVKPTQPTGKPAWSLARTAAMPRRA